MGSIITESPAMRITIEVEETETRKLDHPGDIHARVVGLKVVPALPDELHLTTDTGFTYVLTVSDSIAFRLRQTGWA